MNEARWRCGRASRWGLAIRWCTLFFAAWLLLSGPAAAQDMGAIRGRVVDADFYLPVEGAVVRTSDGTRAARTDRDGLFLINNVPPGSYTVTAGREGYIPSSGRVVSVRSGAVAEADFELVLSVLELDAFMVEGEDLIGSDSVALLDIRQNLTSFVDAIGADFISKAGGSDAGDILKRLVGTSVADSRYVVVRGLSDRYNTVTLNGLRIPSSDPDKRAVNVDLFPSSIVQTLSNSKTYSPELPSESTGGYINIVTKSNAERNFLESSFGLAYNTQATGNAGFVMYRGGGIGPFGRAAEKELPGFMKNSTPGDLPEDITQDQALRANQQRAARAVNPTTGVTVASAPMDTSFGVTGGWNLDFMGRPLGLLGAFTYNKSYTFDPDVIRNTSQIQFSSIGGQTFRSTFVKRTFKLEESSQSLLSGLLLSAGWQATENDLLKVTFFSNIAVDDDALFGKGLALATNSDDPSRSTIENAERYIVREVIEYTERRLSTIQIAGDHQLPAFGDALLQWGAAYSMSSQNQPDVRFVTYVADTPTKSFAPLEGFSGKPIERNWRRLDDTNYNMFLQTRVPLFASATEQEKASLLCGVAFDYSTRDYRADNFGYPSVPVGALPDVVGPDDRLGFTLGDVVGSTAPFLGRVGSFEAYRAEQAIASAFASFTFNLASSLAVSVGARVEEFNLRVFRDFSEVTLANGDVDAAIALAVDLNTGELLPPEKVGRAAISETSVLPVITTVWDLPTQTPMKLKFAATRTVARPSFKEIAPVFERDPATTSRFVGNQALRPSNITNLDVRWEWFPAPGDVFAVSFFTKLIDDPIELTSSPNFDYYVNEKSAILYGYEFEASKKLDFLGDTFKYLSVGINGTRMYSTVEFSDASKAKRVAGLSQTRRLQGQPDYLLNFNLQYDNTEWGLFAGLFLNITGETLYSAGGSVGGDIGVDVFQRPHTSLDATISKKFGDFKVTLRAQNLLNDDLERFSERGLEYAKSAGTKYSISIGGKW